MKNSFLQSRISGFADLFKTTSNLYVASLEIRPLLNYSERLNKLGILTMPFTYCPAETFFSERKKLSASTWPKDVVRRAASIRVDSRASFVDSPLETLRPPLLRVMQNTGHCILSPLKKRIPAGHP